MPTLYVLPCLLMAVPYGIPLGRTQQKPTQLVCLITVNQTTSVFLQVLRCSGCLHWDHWSSLTHNLLRNTTVIKRNSSNLTSVKRGNAFDLSLYAEVAKV